MAYITGAGTSAGIKQGSTYGTAVAVGTGNKLILENINSTRAVTVGTSNGIGSGLSMDKTANPLAINHNVSLTQQARYNDGGLPLILALFMGASTASPQENNTGEGDYFHRITFDDDANKFATIAYEVTTTATFEFPSCYASSVTINTGETPGYLEYSADFIADNKVITSSTNTNATLAAATALGDSIIAHTTSDYFWFNSQSGDALDSGDAICPNSITMNYARPKALSRCFGGTNILNDDKLVVTVTLNFDTLADMTHFTAHHSGTEHKALFNIQGAQLGAGDNESISCYFPRLKAVESPDYNVTDPGANGFSVTYQALVASANPTGMDSIYPYFEFVNGNSAAIIS